MAVSYLLLQVVRACAGVLTNVSSAVKVRLKSYCTCLLMWHHLTYNSMIFTLWYNALGDPFICYWLYLANKYQWDIYFKVNFLSNWKLTFFFRYASRCNKDPQLTLCFKCNYFFLKLKDASLWFYFFILIIVCVALGFVGMGGKASVEKGAQICVTVPRNKTW